MITEEMKREAFNSSEFMKKQPTIDRELVSYVSAKNQTLNQNSGQLSEATMKQELQDSKPNNDWRQGPRDFYNNTKNNETIQAFFFRHNLKTSGEYRAEFLDKDIHQVTNANDLCFRAMTLQHKADLASALPSERTTLDRLHAFEKAHMDYSEKKDLKQYENLQQQSNAYHQVKELFQDYKAKSLGYEKQVQHTAQQPTISQNKPSVSPTMESVQEKMMKMRLQQKQSQSLSI
jgi:hypothetical protein